MGLESARAGVQLTDEFTLDERMIILINTPGFDDNPKTSREVLRMLRSFLATT